MSIGTLSLEARVLYTGFLVFLLVGFFSAAWLYASSFGDLSGEGAADYYLGSDPPPAAASAGPRLELPESPGGLRLQKPARQVMETFHFHLFTVPVVLLVVGHLFMLTALSTRAKVAVILLATAGTLLHLAAPLAVRFFGAALGFLVPSSAVIAAAGWLPMLVWPIWEMWRPGRAQEELE
ncbi:MAG: hypothetical protein HYZ28_14260 [Myxococcales bacterium]|nr:hypothetical protein [Myxococcales bacterium]